MIRKGLLQNLKNTVSVFANPKSPAAIYKNPYPFLSQVYVRLYNRGIKPLGPKKVECIVCKKKNYDFGKMAAISINLIADHYICLSCRSNARTRTGLYCLREILPKKFSILDIGPVSSTKKFFRNYDCDYRTLDKFGEADYNDDITDMGMEDSKFDFVMCIHILEHVDDDIKAMKEIKRILKKSGTALIMVPQEQIKKTKRSRIKPFRGYGHIRLYGDDFAKRLESAGFRVKTKSYSDKKMIRKYGLLEDKIFLAKPL